MSVAYGASVGKLFEAVVMVDVGWLPEARTGGCGGGAPPDIAELLPTVPAEGGWGAENLMCPPFALPLSWALRARRGCQQSEAVAVSGHCS